MRIVAVKQIRLEGLNTEEIAQLMQEVDLVKKLSHSNVIGYEGMARASLRNTLSIALECVLFWLRHVFILTSCVALRVCTLKDGLSSSYSWSSASLTRK